MYKFRTEYIFQLFDTNEIVDALPDEDENMDFLRKRKGTIKSETWEIDEEGEGDE